MTEEQFPQGAGESNSPLYSSPQDDRPMAQASALPPSLSSQLAEKVKAELHKVIIGLDGVIDECLAALLVEGHILFEGYPGLAKTLLVKLLARTLDIRFGRIQFTPDLMPSDVIGTQLLDMKEQSFRFRPGPIFANLVLIDEINRAPAKTQSALFEVMEERQVTIEGHSHPLPPPFLVIGTQNPIDQEGTYRLPEAQLDRFLFKVLVPYPSREEEAAILQRFHNNKREQLVEEVQVAAGPEELRACAEEIQQIHVEQQIMGYIADLVQASRTHPHVYMGASPRASLALLRASKAFAALAGRKFVTPDDVQRACGPVLKHRLILNAGAEMEGFETADVVKNLIEMVEVPR